MVNHISFKKVVFNWVILRPELGCQPVDSILMCAVLCANLKCTTMNFLQNEQPFICQMNKKKASCMTKREVFREPGSRMFQKKVIRTFGIWSRPEHVLARFESDICY